MVEQQFRPNLAIETSESEMIETFFDGATPGSPKSKAVDHATTRIGLQALLELNPADASEHTTISKQLTMVSDKIEHEKNGADADAYMAAQKQFENEIFPLYMVKAYDELEMLNKDTSSAHVKYYASTCIRSL